MSQILLIGHSILKVTQTNGGSYTETNCYDDSKMDNAIKSGHPAMERYKEDKVVFIIDECHRTQFGSMHRIIRQHSETLNTLVLRERLDLKNASQDGRATADILENVYTII